MRNFFLFKPFCNGFLLTNETGNHILLSQDEFKKFIYCPVELPMDIKTQLQQKFFLIDSCSLELNDALRQQRSPSFHGPNLHIFVITNACNYQCVYCQASAPEQPDVQVMTVETACKAVNLALSSPESELTFEFQGGEPLLGFDRIKQIVAIAEEKKNSKTIHYTLVSNLSLLTDHMISFFADHAFSISTSLDGNALLQHTNRKAFPPFDSFEDIKKGISLLRDAGIPISAIETTTRHSFGHDQEIINTYLSLGFHTIFIRPLTPLGKAHETWKTIGYTSKEYLDFYLSCIDDILEANRNGNDLREVYASLLLARMSGNCRQRYMELSSPCGGGTGQIAYGYDGNVYTCDEGRMLATMGNNLFRMGSVNNNYQSLLKSAACKAVCSTSVLESLPECSGCVYLPYCGTCPVVNMACSNELISQEANGYRCAITKGILDDLFERLYTHHDNWEPTILLKWGEML